MNGHLHTVWVPAGVPTFHMPSAHEAFSASLDLLTELCPGLDAPEDILFSPDEVCSFLTGRDPDLIIFENITFANAAYAGEVMHAFPDVPIVLWALREPAGDGGRLRLNSLTGAFSAANTVRPYHRPAAFVLGSPDEPAVRRSLLAAVRAASAGKALSSLTLAQIGHTPQGFGFGRALDADMLRTFGVRLTSVEVRELTSLAETYTPEECLPFLQDAESRTRGLDAIPENNRLGFSALYRAYDTFIKDNHIGALASRCWPDLFTAYGTPVCAVLGILNDLGIAAACETDAYGALSMYIGQQLSGAPVFFGDPSALDENENTITFWHCGTAACSLAREDTGACIGVHCNRGIGPTLEFGCRPSERAVLFRVGRSPEGKFRFLIEPGSVCDRPQQYAGTSLVMKPDRDAAGLVQQLVRDGWEPHFCVIYGDVAEELSVLADILGIENWSRR